MPSPTSPLHGAGLKLQGNEARPVAFKKPPKSVGLTYAPGLKQFSPVVAKAKRHAASPSKKPDLSPRLALVVRVEEETP